MHEFSITPGLKKCALANRRYKEFLGKTRNLSKQSEKEKKRKLKLAEVGEIRKQRLTVQNTTSSLEKDIVKYSIEEEEKQTIINKSKKTEKTELIQKNSREKSYKMSQLDESIQSLEEELRKTSDYDFLLIRIS